MHLNKNLNTILNSNNTAQVEAKLWADKRITI